MTDRDALLKLYEILDNTLELNMDNYNEDQVDMLNNGMIEAYVFLSKYLENKGESHD